MGMSPELRVLEEQDAALVLKECVELALEEEKLQRLHDVSVRLGIEDWKDDLSAIISAARANDIEVERLKEFAERNAAELLAFLPKPAARPHCRSEEHTSELQSLMRISYAVFCLEKKKTQ